MAIAASLVAMTSFAQTMQFSQPTYLTTATNSGVLAVTPFNVVLPPIALTITATNPATVVTNTIYQVIAQTNSYTFVYSAATMGTNFTTNFNGGNTIVFQVTNRTYGIAVPQSGGSNTCFIQ